MKLFTAEFMDELRDRTKHLDIIQYIMCKNLKSFHDAVLELSEFACMTPVYCDKDDE